MQKILTVSVNTIYDLEGARPLDQKEVDEIIRQVRISTSKGKTIPVFCDNIYIGILNNLVFETPNIVSTILMSDDDGGKYYFQILNGAVCGLVVNLLKMKDKFRIRSIIIVRRIPV